jgi:hypothetical protein
MKPSFLIVVAVSAVVYLSGCSRTPSNPEAALVGQYQLYVGHGNYSGRGIERSTLELRADGSSEQRGSIQRRFSVSDSREMEL